MHAKSSMSSIRKTNLKTFLVFDIQCSFHFNILDSFTHILSIFIWVLYRSLLKAHVNVELSYFISFAYVTMATWLHSNKFRTVTRFLIYQQTLAPNSIYREMTLRSNTFIFRIQTLQNFYHPKLYQMLLYSRQNYLNEKISIYFIYE